MQPACAWTGARTTACGCRHRSPCRRHCCRWCQKPPVTARGARRPPAQARGRGWPRRGSHRHRWHCHGRPGQAQRHRGQGLGMDSHRHRWHCHDRPGQAPRQRGRGLGVERRGGGTSKRCDVVRSHVCNRSACGMELSGGQLRQVESGGVGQSRVGWRGVACRCYVRVGVRVEVHVRGVCVPDLRPLKLPCFLRSSLIHVWLVPVALAFSCFSSSTIAASFCHARTHKHTRAHAHAGADTWGHGHTGSSDSGLTRGSSARGRRWCRRGSGSGSGRSGRLRQGVAGGSDTVEEGQQQPRTRWKL